MTASMVTIRLAKLNATDHISLETFKRDPFPAYAILSHTWSSNNADELSFEDVDEENDCSSKSGYQKVLACLQQARSEGIEYCWIDTCCINKNRSQELNEAIISMFRWYQRAVKCYAYLYDVSSPNFTPEGSNQSYRPRWETELMNSKWFTRGWTLQELLAPSVVEFFSADWKLLGDRISLDRIIHTVSRIPIEALRSEKPLTAFGIEERMSWVRTRRTSRPEDMAYCLLGIFDVTVPPAYGEGEKRALGRLEEAIDTSLRRRNQNIKRFPSSNWHEAREHRPSKRPRLTAEPPPDPEQIRALMESLRFGEIDARRVTIREAHSKTCRWLLSDPQYLAWQETERKNEHGGFLWIKGKPGSGKSTIMKFALGNARRGRKDRIVLSFFFNARGTQLEKSVVGLYRTLLVQLLEQMPSLQSIFQTALGTRTHDIGGDHDWSVESLQELLTEGFRSLGESSLVCFIDALDECEEDEVRDMISFLSNLCQETASGGGTTQICFASRHYSHITIPKEIKLVLDDKTGHEQDIVDYLAGELRIGRSQFAEDVRSEILQRASGIFIWIVLVVRILNKAYDQGGRRQLRQKLADIPDDIFKLFRAILTRDSDNREGTKLCIQWILFAKEPLTPPQLYSAVLTGIEGPQALKSDISSIEDVEDKDEGEADEHKFILANSKGLAEIIKPTEVTQAAQIRTKSTVQFFHESVKDFLLKGKGFAEIWPDQDDNVQGQSHERLKQCCLSYIRVFPETYTSGYDHRDEFSSSEASDRRHHIDTECPFLRYAAANILYHADQASKHGVHQNRFLLGFETNQWIQLMNILQRRNLQRYSPSASLIYCLAAVNTPNLIREHPDALFYLRSENERYGTPLFAALACGHKAAALAFLTAYVERQNPDTRFDDLLTRCSEDPSWQGKFGITFKPVKSRDVADELYVNSSGSMLEFIANTNFDKGLTARIFVKGARFGDLGIVSRMLDAGVSPNTRDKFDSSALSAASGTGHGTIVELLLAKGATLDHDAAESSALARASGNGHDTVVTILLENGASDDEKFKLGCHWALNKASKAGHAKVVDQLLAVSTDLTGLRQEDLDQALIDASLHGREKAVETLVSHGAKVNTRGESGMTALMLMSKGGYVKAVETLLLRGADGTAQNVFGLNAAMIAMVAHGKEIDQSSVIPGSRRAYKKIVTMLLPYTTEVDIRTISAETALMMASHVGFLEAVDMLLLRGAEVNAMDAMGVTALMAASMRGWVEVVKTLLLHGAEVNTRTGSDATALLYASSMGHWTIVEMLLSRGAELNAQTRDYGLALHCACGWGNGEMVKMLLAAGADINLCDRVTGRSAIQFASRQGYGEIVEILLTHGADVNNTDFSGTTALSEARKANHSRVIEILLASGADSTVFNKE